jgi:hypothetical protein
VKDVLRRAVHSLWLEVLVDETGERLRVRAGQQGEGTTETPVVLDSGLALGTPF